MDLGGGKRSVVAGRPDLSDLIARVKTTDADDVMPLADALAADAPESARRTALAQWLTDPRHPLTARVLVNRIWQHHFGSGLVKTPSDFGLRAEQPSHPELLDWLAVEFVESGWNMKAMHKLIVMSFCMLSDAELAVHRPRVVIVAPGNRVGQVTEYPAE